MRAFNAETLEEERAAIMEACSSLLAGGWSYWTEASKLQSQLGSMASKEIREDAEVALACLSVDGSWLRLFAESLRAEKRIVLPAVWRSSHALAHASPELRGDKEVVLAAVSSFGSALEFASKELQADKEVVMAAVTKDGSVLRYAGEELRSDKDVVLAAVGRRGDALGLASEQLRGDKEVVQAAVRNDGEALQSASLELKGDRDVVLAAVGRNPRVIEYATEKARGDKEVVLLATRTFGRALIRASEDLREDKDFVLLVARQSSRFQPPNWYHQAGGSVKAAISEEAFLSAVESALAVSGQVEAAPTVLVTLTKSSSENGDGERFHANARFGISGEEFVCDLLAGSRDGGPVLNDLANELVSKLRQDGKMGEQQQHIFITFLSSENDDPVAVTPWDHERPLREFLSAQP